MRNPLWCGGSILFKLNSWRSPIGRSRVLIQFMPKETIMEKSKKQQAFWEHPNPVLAGKKEDQIIQALKDYKSGKRDNAVMKGMASSLSDQDIANVAAYFASLK